MNRRGFTLIELLVVIAIIALLMSVVVPSMRKAKDAARMMLCANNQHQTLTGLFAYASDHAGLYPPHPAERPNGSFGVVNYLNYAQHDKSRSKHEGTYHYLGGYLPRVDMFVCPLGPAKDLAELQRQYVDYKTKTPYYTLEGTQTSYNLYWGGYTFQGGLVGAMEFNGPTGKGDKMQANLLVSDSVFYWGAVTGYNDFWLAHKPNRGSGEITFYTNNVDPQFGNYVEVFWIYRLANKVTGPLPSGIQDLKMNAGYTDGSVVRYNGENTSIVWTDPTNLYYIPRKWR